MKYGSLFSGIGGFDLGFDRAGMECAWQCEINGAARGVLQRHWPHVSQNQDVNLLRGINGPAFSRRDADWWDWPQSVDLICGGFPCQDVSVAGQRKGLAGKRSGLWFEFHRVLAELKPEWAVIENVYGLLSSNGGRDFAVILRGLEELGYGVGWRTFDAQYAGVAQRRRRVFIVGHLGDGRAAEVLFERQSDNWDSAPRRAAGQRVAGTLAAAQARNRGLGLENETDFLVSLIDVRSLVNNGDISGTLQAKSTGGWSLNYQNPISISRRIHRWVDEEDRIRAVQGDKKSSTVQEHVYHKTHGATDALTTARPPKIIETGVRRLTPVECERLQGFPDGWTQYRKAQERELRRIEKIVKRWERETGETWSAPDGCVPQSDAQRYFQLGNAVCVNEAESLGSRIVAVA
jgi:DNA (cytosine-5)-methyltransferase 1